MPFPNEAYSAYEGAVYLRTPSFYEKLEASTDEKEREELQITLELAEVVRDIGGRALVVGGYARDEVFKYEGWELTPKDIDIEVYGVPFNKLVKILKSRGKVDAVGKSYLVLKFKGMDVSIPRTDRKTGDKHGDFESTGHADFSIKEAAPRRDLTINALALDPLTGEIIDEVGGVQDIKDSVLRAVDRNTFGEDALRVLRVVQFAGRFNFKVDPGTAELCRSIDLSKIADKRIGDEWLKLLEKSNRPSVGMEIARDIGVIEKLHPELNALISCPQDPEWHPEGDVWTHTKMVVDEAADIARRRNLDEEETRVLMLAALTHDFGKPATTIFNVEKNRYTAHGHETAGVEPAKRFLKPFEVPSQLKERVFSLVKYHMYPSTNPDASDTALRRLAAKLHPATIQELILVAEADHRGRAVQWPGFKQPDIAARAIEIGVSDGPQKRLIEGHQLQKRFGIEPGKLMGVMINMLYELQLDGKFNDAASAEKHLEDSWEGFRSQAEEQTAILTRRREDIMRQRHEAIMAENAERKRIKRETHLRRMEEHARIKASQT